MARRPKGREELQQDDLNLAPMMNLVIILIPLLLMSVVFLEVGVINITAPTLSVGAPTDEKPPPDEEPLNLTLAISADGIRIAATGAVLPARDGCPPQGPTLCLGDSTVDVTAKFEEARRFMAQGSQEQGEASLDEALAAYNFRDLYNQLARIKKEYPDETVVTLSADADIPFAVLVRVMDVSRFKLVKESYDSNSEFWDAEYETDGNQFAILFGDPVLSILQ
ncbi:MAG: biopolymer transporter ExbD [Bradymonadaceae bacterium]